MNAILDLQRVILKPSSSIGNILHYIYLIARKLKSEELIKFCELEIYGYFKSNINEVPYYRWIKGNLLTKNTETGEIFTLPASDLESVKILRDSISRLENYNYDEKFFINITIDSNIDIELRRKHKIDNNFLIYLKVNKTEIDHAIYLIKSKALEFSCQLEDLNVLGDNWSFSEEEVKKTTNYHIETVQNMANHGTNSTIIQNTEFNRFPK